MLNWEFFLNRVVYFSRAAAFATALFFENKKWLANLFMIKTNFFT